MNREKPRSIETCAVLELQWKKETDPEVRASMLEREKEGDQIQKGLYRFSALVLYSVRFKARNLKEIDY